MPSTQNIENRQQLQEEALRLRDLGYTFQYIADRLGFVSRQAARTAANSAARRAGRIQPRSNRRTTPSTGTRRSTGLRNFGIEIEFNGISRDTAAAALRAAGVDARTENYNHPTRDYWKLITDASVSGTGLELVSPILCGEEGFAQVKLVMDTLTAAGGRVDRSCGMHVHHDAAGLSGDDIANIVEVYVANQDAIDRLVAPSRRGQSQWASRLSSREVQALAQSFRTTGTTTREVSRYRSINTASYVAHGTIEIRQHQGSLSADKAVAWIKFGQALIRAAVARTNATTPNTVFELLSHLSAEHALDTETAEFLATRAFRLSANS